MKMQFDYIAGDKVLKAELSQPNGVGDDSWWLSVGGYHWGVLTIRNGNYVFYGNGEVYGDDILEMVDRISANEKAPT